MFFSQQDFHLSGLLVTSMTLYERPKTPSKRPRSSNENHIGPLDQPNEDRTRRKSLFNAKSSNPNSRRNSMEQQPSHDFDDEENEMFIHQAAEIDEKFFIQPPQSKVEIFVKSMQATDETEAELEDIEGSDDDDDDV